MQGADDTAEEGATRFAADGTVEVFNGTRWLPYQPVIDDGFGVIFKGGPPPAPPAGDASPAVPASDPPPGDPADAGQ